MNSKQRVEAAISLKPVDQVPLGLHIADYDTIEEVLGHPTLVRNKVEIQIALWEGRRDEVAESMKTDVVEFYKKIDCNDIILPKEACLLPPKDYEPENPSKIDENTWEDSQGRIFRANRESNDIVCVYAPKKDYQQYNIEDFQKPLDVIEPDKSIFEAIDHMIDSLGQNKYVACTSARWMPFPAFGDMQTGLMACAERPELIKAMNHQTTDLQNQLDKFYINPKAPGIFEGVDTGTTRGPLLSPGMFRDLYFPYIKERVANFKKFGKQLIMHNCGNNIALMDMFIETDIDCYQSLQTNTGMDVGLLKEKYGDKMCFWGGVATEKLVAGTPEDVRKDVRNAMEQAGRGTGFILGPSHSIAKGTKYENFMAMLDEFVKLRDKY